MIDRMIDLIIIFLLLAWWFIGPDGDFKTASLGLAFLWSFVRIFQELIIFTYKKLIYQNKENNHDVS